MVAGDSSRPDCFDSTREPTGWPSTTNRSTKVLSRYCARGSSILPFYRRRRCAARSGRSSGRPGRRSGSHHASVGYGGGVGCALIAAMTAETTAASRSNAAALRRVALVGRQSGAELADPLSRLAAFLAANGHDVVIEERTAHATPLPAYPSSPAEALAGKADVAVVVGGDGTMLGIARRLAPLNVPVIGINQGRLGFLTDIPIARMESALAAMLKGRYVEERRTLLVAEVVHADSSRESALALNDVVLNRGGGGTMIECAVEI